MDQDEISRRLGENISRLRTLGRQLLGRVEHVSVRALDSGPFLYATNAGRAIEASTNNVHWWLEFWERRDDEYAEPVKECALEGEAEVLRAVLDWLLQAG
jgi:hypothetical protein